MLPRLFDIFQQGDRVPGRVTEGLGLGLSVVRNLVELHGGRVTASSAGPGQGSEFVVRLPALPPGTKADPSEQVTPANSSSGVSLRILITDDNRDAAESMAMLLRMSGHEVRTAVDGPATLNLARSFRPQAIFLDIGLPRGMDGYEVARRLRRQEGLERVLLVAMTGYGQDEDRERSKLAGFDYHLVKPADLDHIGKLLSERADAE
jgi:CheY-like chemotaxis protein